MSEMVERVAGAIYDAAGDCDQEMNLAAARALARAAIAAMREPTEAMKAAGGFAYMERGGMNARDGSDDIWRAMIDAALKQAGGGDR